MRRGKICNKIEKRSFFWFKLFWKATFWQPSQPNINTPIYWELLLETEMRHLLLALESIHASVG